MSTVIVKLFTITFLFLLRYNFKNCLFIFRRFSKPHFAANRRIGSFCGLGTRTANPAARSGHISPTPPTSTGSTCNNAFLQKFKKKCKRAIDITIILCIIVNVNYETGTNKGHTPGSRQPDSLRKACTGGAVHPAKQINAVAPASLGKKKKRSGSHHTTRSAPPRRAAQLLYRLHRKKSRRELQ